MGDKDKKKDKGNKIKLNLTADQLAALFRKLANQLDETVSGTDGIESKKETDAEARAEIAGASIKTGENAPKETETGIQIQQDDLSKLKMEIKRKGELFLVKMKIKYQKKDEVHTDDDDDDDDDYKDLKKHMEKTFKKIMASLQEDRLPPDEIVRSFVKDTASMADMAEDGKGDHSQFKSACDEFWIAYEQKDFALAKEKCNRLDEMKNDCHAKYK